MAFFCMIILVFSVFSCFFNFPSFSSSLFFNILWELSFPLPDFFAHRLRFKIFYYSAFFSILTYSSKASCICLKDFVEVCSNLSLLLKVSSGIFWQSYETKNYVEISRFIILGFKAEIVFKILAFLG